MKKELEEGLKTLDFITEELESLKDYLEQNNVSSVAEDITSLQQENAHLKRQLIHDRQFITSILETLNDIAKNIEELKNHE
ncbi:MAG: hypothetical protein LBQ34_04375 [Alphaproteobacteria bacterium]|nr:hypothetical protein [Alphaproteobacteria bacterium]